MGYAKGPMAVDWEERYDFVALRTKRIAKVRAELRGSDLDAVLLWKNENVRYLTSLRAQIIAYKASSLNGVLLSPTSEPILLCSGGELDKARFGMPWLASSHAIPIMEQRELVDGFVTDILTPQLRELGVTGGRLGIDQANLSLIEAVTMDGGHAYIGATRAKAPQATICFDAFHVIKWANEALDAVFRASAIPTIKAQMQQTRSNAAWRKARYALRSGRHNLKKEHRQLLGLIRAERIEVHKAYLLKEELRDLFQIIEPDEAQAYLTGWIRRAANSTIRPMNTLARKIQNHFDGIVAAVQLGLSNSRSEGINTKIRVIQRRGYGYPNPTSLTAMIYLCCSGMKTSLPTQT